MVRPVLQAQDSLAATATDGANQVCYVTEDLQREKDFQHCPSPVVSLLFGVVCLLSIEVWCLNKQVSRFKNKLKLPESQCTTKQVLCRSSMKVNVVQHTQS